MTTGERKPWHAVFRLLERDERVFAGLLAVAMVAGLATLGLVPLRPRQQIDLSSLVLWFTLYKIGVFALVTVYPTRTRAIPDRARRCDGSSYGSQRRGRLGRYAI